MFGEGEGFDRPQAWASNWGYDRIVGAVANLGWL
jgi:hypothetical protein